MPITKVSTGVITDSAVTTTQIADATIVNADVNTSAAIANSKMATNTTDASNLATGTVPTARLGSGTASATTFLRGDQSYATISEYNDANIRNDIATLALNYAVSDNKAAFNLTNAFVDQFEDGTGIDTETTTQRNGSEYMASAVDDYGTLAYGLTANWGSSNVTTANTNDGLTIVHASTPDSDTGIWSYENSSTGNPSTPFKFSADLPFQVEFKPFGNHAYGPYGIGLAPVGSPHTGAFTSANITTGSMKANTYWPHWQGAAATSDIWANGVSVFGPFTDPGIQGSGTPNYYLFKRSSSGAMVLWRKPDGGTYTIFHTFTFAYAGEMQMMFTGAGGRDSYAKFLKYVQGTFTYNAAGNWTSTDQTALSTVSTMSIIVLYKNNAGTATLDTDLVAQVSSNGGTNYTSAPLTAAGTFSTGILVAKSNAITISNTGTAPKYKISFANQLASSKETQVHGVALLY